MKCCTYILHLHFIRFFAEIMYGNVFILCLRGARVRVTSMCVAKKVNTFIYIFFFHPNISFLLCALNLFLHTVDGIQNGYVRVKIPY